MTSLKAETNSQYFNWSDFNYINGGRRYQFIFMIKAYTLCRRPTLEKGHMDFGNGFKRGESIKIQIKKGVLKFKRDPEQFSCCQ